MLRTWLVWPVAVGVGLGFVSAGCARTGGGAGLVGARGEEAVLPRARAALYRLEHSPADAEVAAGLRAVVGEGVARVEGYFGRAFVRPFVVEIGADRAAFDASLPAEWGLSQTACWMVATGVADGLRMLSPRVWREEACEHDGEDAEHVRGIVVHELTHVFHGQHNPTGDFVGAEEVGWFAEGLAVVVSGQMEEKAGDARAALESGQGPARLAEAWSGRYRYGVSGSLVAFMEERIGRAGLFEALGCTRQAELLALLELDEARLLESWRGWVMRGE